MKKIDRQAVVQRHRVVNSVPDIHNPLSVGNGSLAYTVDITGLQTFGSIYTDIPLCTMAAWGWHSMPYSSEHPYPELTDLTPTWIRSGGREVPYYTDAHDQDELYNWLRENPHRYNLMALGFVETATGVAPQLDSIEACHQELDLWTGQIQSVFTHHKHKVRVITVCDPEEDVLSFHITGARAAELKLSLGFPLPGPAMNGVNDNADHMISSQVSMGFGSSNEVFVRRCVDREGFDLRISGEGHSLSRRDENSFDIEFDSDIAQLTVHLQKLGDEPFITAEYSFSEVVNRCKQYWSDFWTSSAAIDLSLSKDDRAMELERRIVLSRYLLAIQCGSQIPPQETGLTCNSWYGRFHLEMHYWHVVHLWQWGHYEMFENAVSWYPKHIHVAKHLATSQGFVGARWPKMTEPCGKDAPSFIGPLLIWQQAHPIVYAELLYLGTDNPERIIEEWSPVVDESIAFLLDYLVCEDGVWHLGPGLIPAQESHHHSVSRDPTLELQYVDLAIRFAELWNQRRGLDTSKLRSVRTNLAPLPILKSAPQPVYAAHANAENTYSEHNRDHPSMLAAYGWLDGTMVDSLIMKHTLDMVLSTWRFETAWGWDFPIMAMTAMRLGELNLAFDCLLMEEPKNTYRKNGHNNQIGHADLPIYLPGNGSLLSAVAKLIDLDADERGMIEHEQWCLLSEGVTRIPF